MVLQKVGEFQTTVNVNGEEKVSTLQSSDKTYNLSESFNTTINVNGNQKVSTNQSSDKTYNITTGPSPTTDTTVVIEYPSGNRDVLGSTQASTISKTISSGGVYTIDVVEGSVSVSGELSGGGGGGGGGGENVQEGDPTNGSSGGTTSFDGYSADGGEGGEGGSATGASDGNGGSGAPGGSGGSGNAYAGPGGDGGNGFTTQINTSLSGSTQLTVGYGGNGGSSNALGSEYEGENGEDGYAKLDFTL